MSCQRDNFFFFEREERERYKIIFFYKIRGWSYSELSSLTPHCNSVAIFFKNNTFVVVCLLIFQLLKQYYSIYTTFVANALSKVFMQLTRGWSSGKSLGQIASGHWVGVPLLLHVSMGSQLNLILKEYSCVGVLANPCSKIYQNWVNQRNYLGVKFGFKVVHRQQYFDLLKGNEFMIFCPFHLHHIDFFSETCFIEMWTFGSLMT